MSEEKPHNAWLVEAIERAKQSALPTLAAGIAQVAGVEVDDVVDAIEAALLTAVIGTPTTESLRSALRVVAEPYATAIDTPWETVADAILGTMEWTPPDPSTWTLDSWNLRRRPPHR